MTQSCNTQDVPSGTASGSTRRDGNSVSDPRSQPKKSTREYHIAALWLCITAYGSGTWCPPQEARTGPKEHFSNVLIAKL